MQLGPPCVLFNDVVMSLQRYNCFCQWKWINSYLHEIKSTYHYFNFPNRAPGIGPNYNNQFSSSLGYTRTLQYIHSHMYQYIHFPMNCMTLFFLSRPLRRGSGPMRLVYSKGMFHSRTNRNVEFKPALGIFPF